MSFKIVHELVGAFSDGTVECQGRIRCRCNERLSMEEATDLADRLGAVDGVLGLSVNPVIGSVLFFYRDQDSRSEAIRILDAAGGEIDALRAQPGYRPPVLEQPKLEGPAACAMQVAQYYMLRPFLPLWWSALSAIWHGIPFIWEGLKCLFSGHLRVSVLDAAAVTVCLLRRDFRTAGTLTLLLGVGETLEAWTRQKSLDSLTDSLAITADMVWIRGENGEDFQKHLSDVVEVDVVIVRSGSSIPVDGTVAFGEGLVNESSMTGEPLGVLRAEGSSVFAGTVVEEGEIGIRVSKIGDETRLRQIVNFIEESESLKAGIQGRFERMADMAVPFTFALAGLVWLLTRDPIRASSVLLVDYSCALKLATPLAVLSAMKEGAGRGCVIKGGRYLEALADVDTVVFDKTGTLTNATPKVVDVVAAPGFDREQVLQDIACLEEHFPHPVASAVVAAAKDDGIDHPEEHGDVQYIVAHGVCALLRGQKVVVGSRHYIETDECIDLTPIQDAIETQVSFGRSLLFVGIGGVIAGLVAIEDPPRPEAAEVIAQLHQIGVSRVLMITGDDERTAKTIAARLGIDEYRAQVLPTDKADVVNALTAEGRHVLMVGDGINDAPALSAASVGLAMSDGTDLAQGVANVLLTTPDLHGIVTAKLLGMSVMKRIHSNFRYTMLFNSLFLAGGIFMILSPGVSALLHNATTVCLTLRAMRTNLRDEDCPYEEQEAQALPVGA